MNKCSILIVEDEYNQRILLSEILSKEGYTVFEAECGIAAKEIFKEKSIDLILLDFKLPDIDGLSLINFFKGINPETEIIIITAFGSIENAVNALKAGAYDYLTKPIDIDDLLIKIKKIEEKKSLIRENLVLKETLKERFKSEDFVYKSEKMQNVASLIVRVATTDSTCLITGESGTGKEIVANMIQGLSLRKEGPFVKVNCSAIPEQLLESELFGYEKGAFTGAFQRKIGKFELAHKGTIFLDEIGDMPLYLQSKLLRVLQAKEIERLGGLNPINVDIRIIAATNKNLEEEVKKGNFREDLYYRINVVRIEIPPLRERKEDIMPLVDFFIKKFTVRHRKETKEITKEARDALLKYDYPGNVRELENIIERAVVLSRGDFLTVEDFFDNASTLAPKKESGIKEVITSVEKEMILESLIKNNWVQTKAAASLGMSERMLRYKMNKYGIKK
ncbi:MAG TPA: sigma-54 dependent transcriptional regulator [Syntrophorhabdaceae bacterium]|nr:sigma-54 dependent transcriptional regulator [Syntrophorhabdaceae bacterium]HPU29915.1 sigma-54 dependent transcriptional regulator [Syntrophorhabdaceae bacterium]